MITPPAEVLARYPTAIARLRWIPLGAAGGFSGAAVWRGDSEFALKAWPTDYSSARLREVHAAITRADLPFVPKILPRTDGQLAVEWGGRVWDMTSWMPGEPIAEIEPTDTRLAAAMTALAALHRAWASVNRQLAVCPGVVRRLAAIEHALRSIPYLTALRPVATQAAAILQPWRIQPLPLQLCLRDVHAAHVLFTENRVSGIIDYGAIGIDHPAVDLARLLGDLVGTEPHRVRQGVKFYQDAGGVAPLDANFVLALADAGLVGSIVRWFDHPPQTPMEARRFQTLIDRLEARAAGGC